LPLEICREVAQDDDNHAATKRSVIVTQIDLLTIAVTPC
jgi:hypothetical protein